MVTVNRSLNDTVEEELRLQLCDQLQTINALKNEIDMLKHSVKEEQDQKYRAYVKISDLQRELSKLQTT